MARRPKRWWKCPDCGWTVRSQTPQPWCDTCKRHTCEDTPCRQACADPAREARIKAHRARVERDMPRAGSMDPLAPWGRPAL